MKKGFGYISAFVLLLLLLGCSAPGGMQSETLVVTTIFPLYDFTREIVSDSGDVELTCLVDSKVDMHSYTPSSQDIMSIAECDVFVYVGGESDAWVDEVLAQHPNEDRVVIRCFDVLEGSLIAEDGSDEGEYDEHVWLSLRNAQVMVDAIAEALEQVDPEGATAYAANAAEYRTQLADLDARYEQTLSGTSRTLLVADRFPFTYLARDYGLRCFSAFSGCSAESEASFQVIAELADALDEHGLTHVFVIDDNDPTVARAVIAQADAEGVEVLSLSSMQAVSASDIDGGTSYLSLMEENLAMLEEGISA